MNKLICLAAFVGLAFANSSKIESTLAKSLDAKHTANVIISFSGGNTQVLKSIETRTFQTRIQRLNSLTSSLKSNSEKSQRKVLSLLKSKSVQYKSFWISNQIYIPDADSNLVNAIVAIPEVESVEEERIITLNTPLSKISNKTADPTPLPEWGIQKIRANEAWAITNGSGVVVATIDTGVRYTHEALRDTWRSDYGWFDPIAATPFPNDQSFHGTHTMGILVGSKESGIGVAPSAQWISCLGCFNGVCYGSDIIACGQWMLCPTKPDGSNQDCSKAPALVSNSYGGGQGTKWFEPVTEAWIAGGIVPIFAIGNGGPSCGTAASSGDLKRVIGVGSTNNRDEISTFSARGPSVDGLIKPEISAPGDYIRSSMHDSDTSYGYASGTSMACPHAAGATALLLSINPNLTFEQVRKALIEAVDTDLASKNNVCGGIADNVFPNNFYGYGRINALKLVQSAKAALKN